MPSIIIADEMALISCGISHLILQKPSWSLLSTIRDFKNLEDQLINHRPDLLIAELTPKFTIRHIQEYIEAGLIKHSLILSWETQSELLKEIYESTITGFIYKNSGTNEIIKAIESCLLGEKYHCQDMLNNLSIDSEDSECLSQRELEVLKLVAKGKSTKAIADMLYVSIHTVNSHRKNIIKKLNISSPVEFVHQAQIRNIL